VKVKRKLKHFMRSVLLGLLVLFFFEVIKQKGANGLELIHHAYIS